MSSPSPPLTISVAQTAPQASSPLLDAWSSLNKAEELRKAGEYGRAKVICERLIKQYPDYVGALYTLGLVLSDAGQDSAAIPHLATAAALNPKDWKTLTVLSGCYVRTGALEMAARVLAEAQRLKPGDPGVLMTLGEIYRQEGEYELATKAFKDTFAIDPSLSAALHGQAICYMSMGDGAAALNCLARIFDSGGRDINAVLLSTQIQGEKSEIDILALLDEVKPRKGQSKDDFDASVEIARGAALDHEGRHAEAWSHVVAGNRLVYPHYAKAGAREAKRRSEVLGLLRKARIRDIENAPDDQPVSLFILGPSRSGKTSFERLAACLEGSKRGYENPVVEVAVRRTFQTAGLPTSDRINELPPGFDGMFSGFYAEELAKRAGGAQLFTNTHPGRLEDVARLAGAIRSARFVFLRRDSDDTTLRIFMRKYLSGNHYAYRLSTIAEYLSWYDEMSDVLLAKLPDRARAIDYDEMIADPRAAVGVVAELCGVPMPRDPLPAIGDDRGCSAPYRELMGRELGS